ncbi:HIT family protein [Paraliomyxa miuraensis]|uniref:HIT family protein n=1 Tax=Paraliomyxa miuraensis TaxID=376150 RepID=UPI00224F88E5|nr:HIT family protein [Paraliomyxa miuraensis]MCX4242275.1 HIT family protein [Paraliomyxa miuraensis]
MPRLISRAEALASIRTEGGEPSCLMCAIRDRAVGPVYAVHEDEHMLVMLPRYVRRWGHLMIMPKAHVVSYSEVAPWTWLEACRLSLHAARVIEHVRRPRRCYVASTGSSAGELTQTSRHLHVHVIPLYEPDDKPADIFSWSEGVWVGEPAEWETLRDAYREAWLALPLPESDGAGPHSSGPVGS